MKSDAGETRGASQLEAAAAADCLQAQPQSNGRADGRDGKYSRPFELVVGGWKGGSPY